MTISRASDAVGQDRQPIPNRRSVRSVSRGDLLQLGERFGLVLFLLSVIALFSIMHPDTFATEANWRVIVSSQAVTLVVALALMIPLLSNNFDLSVGSVAGMSAMLAAGVMARNHWSLLVACFVVLVLGMTIGLFNGLLVTKLGLNGLIATLGTSTILDGALSWYSKNLSISYGISDGLVEFGTKTIAGLPWLAAVAVIIAALVAYVVTQTPVGRKLVAIGSSSPAARLVGIRVDAIVLGSYVISGILGAGAGILLLAQQGSASPGANGISFLLPALAAVFLGASTWRPGQFNVMGTILGLLLVAITVSGFTLSGAASWVNSVCYGAALIVAVGASAWFRRRRTGA
ncbi:ABC transporter permease [Nocardia nova]|uniref:ABC transporter permease n=1 Tax=Nocardia nova TaxID=37330 RepID=A0A2S6AKH1_9NOCA|nr:ABC transporter permease [Nocardia nova]PPJ35712.1 ABC transporter permease [Nocardia nova]